MTLWIVLEILSIVTLPLLGEVALSRHSNGYLPEFFNTIILQYLALYKPHLMPALYAVLIFLCYFGWQNRKHKKTPEASLGFDMHRALVMAPVVICIFMCDFSFWVPRFGKTEGTGIGLMDAGIGAFLFNAGFFSSRISPYKLKKNILFLSVLGLVRLLVVKCCHLSVNPKEYGYHLNFYFTLAMVNTLFWLFNSRYNLRVGIALLFAHECLVGRVSHIILSDDRSNLILQNKEGLFSIVPHFGCFLIANYIGTVLLSALSNRKRLLYSVMYFKISFVAYLISSYFSVPNRMLSNFSFMILVMSIQIYSSTMCAFAATYCASLLGPLPLIRFVSRNMMLVFLFSNLLVLVFKLLFDLDACSHRLGHFLNLVYLVTNFVALPAVGKCFKIKFIS